MKGRNKKMKKFIALLLTALMALCCLTACSGTSNGTSAGTSTEAASGSTVKVGICNYVDDASLNQIVDSIQSRLSEIGAEKGVTFDVSYDNCNADANLMSQIISNFIADGVDIMIGVATPVAMAMQAATEDNQIPVVFAAVSDPVSTGLVDSLEAPGSNVTGTSDYLDTAAVMNLMFAANPNTKKVALLYDLGQDSSATPIAAAKADLDARNVEYSDYTGTTVDEVVLAVQSIIADGADAVFTPTDNTVMKAELSIYELLADAGIPHYTGADSFALNGAFLGYGVDYANLGRETADMVASIALDGKNPAELPVLTFDNGCATVNTETCEALGYNYDEIAQAFAPYCTKVESIVTAESFDELNK